MVVNYNRKKTLFKIKDKDTRMKQWVKLLNIYILNIYGDKFALLPLGRHPS